MLRTIQPQDTPTLLELTSQTGVFKPIEIDALEEVLDDYHECMKDLGHRAFHWSKKGQILGYVYYAPAVMTEGTWYLYWIAVSKDAQGKGIGGKLLHHCEKDIAKRKGRVLFIETSSLPSYDLTRKFYINHNYEVGGVLRGFYAEGDDMVVFRKELK